MEKLKPNATLILDVDMGTMLKMRMSDDIGMQNLADKNGEEVEVCIIPTAAIDRRFSKVLVREEETGEWYEFYRYQFKEKKNGKS